MKKEEIFITLHFTKDETKTMMSEINMMSSGAFAKEGELLTLLANKIKKEINKKKKVKK